MYDGLTTYLPSSTFSALKISEYKNGNTNKQTKPCNIVLKRWLWAIWEDTGRCLNKAWATLQRGCCNHKEWPTLSQKGKGHKDCTTEEAVWWSPIGEKVQKHGWDSAPEEDLLRWI